MPNYIRRNLPTARMSNILCTVPFESICLSSTFTCSQPCELDGGCSQVCSRVVLHTAKSALSHLGSSLRLSSTSGSRQHGTARHCNEFQRKFHNLISPSKRKAFVAATSSRGFFFFCKITTCLVRERQQDRAR